jgi:NADH dehydrogenase FAD-containing subunit
MTATPPRVLVLGAGVAALETAFLVEQRLSGRTELAVVCDQDDFVLRPNLVYVPFGADPGMSTIDASDALMRKGIQSTPGRVEGVDASAGYVCLADGTRLAYEHLVIATGAAPRLQEVPGLAEHAVAFWDSDAMLALQERFARVRGRAREGTRQRVVFVVPQHCQSASPLYEIALMLDTWLRRENARGNVDVVFLTQERAFAEPCGPRMHEVLEHEFAERGIGACTSERLIGVREGEASFAEGRAEPFDLLVTAPPLAPAVRYEGLPLDDRGFLRVESATRQVIGHPELYAPGDAGDFPVKDAFLGLLQADAVADHLCAVVTAGTFKRPFDAVSMQILDMLDRAAFAQLPLEATGDPDHPVRLRAGADGDYKVGVSPVWRGSKRMFSSYLLMRFTAGEPFHAGAGWRFMDLGVRAMAGMLAE